MNRLPAAKRIAILAALTNGAGINATSRQVQVSHVTVLKLLAEIGTAVLDFQAAHVRSNFAEFTYHRRVGTLALVWAF